MEPNRAWFILYTTPEGEAAFCETLRKRLGEAGLGDRLLDFIIPGGPKAKLSLLRSLTGQQPVWALPSRRPGTIYVRLVMDDAVWQIIISMPELAGYEGTGGEPALWPGLRPKAYLPSNAAQAAQQEVSPDPNTPWKAGDKVHILAGPFIDFHGTVAHVDMERRMVRVMINVFGRPTPVELRFDALEMEP